MSVVSYPPLKAVVLAAGKETLVSSNEKPMLLQKLGERSILEHVLQNVLQVVKPEDTYIVVGERQTEIRQALGERYQYVVQDAPKGTGHAVLQVGAYLGDFVGDLLIVYGDTPLFRPASVRGLINRHRLRQAQLTLLTAVLAEPLPYGRIVRDSDERIVDIVEESDASPRVRNIHELNVGAYVGDAATVFATLKRLAPSSIGDIRLTDCAYRIIHAGQVVESYQIYDPDEVQGINSASDFKQAEFILQKRFYRPRRQEEQNQVLFGTGGWRAIIGEGYTLHNVRRLCQALANDITRKGEEKKGVLVGYDRRFLSRQSGEAAAEVFAGNNIPVILLPEDAPTPLITYATDLVKASYGLAFTASHNPPEWNGLKVFHCDGSLLLDHETRQIEQETNAMRPEDVIKLELDLAEKAGMVVWRDYTNEYVDAVEAFLDMDAIRKAGLRVIVDPMYGVGQLTLGTILTEARCRVTFIHDRHNPLFGGRSPSPNLDALRVLVTQVKEEKYHLGLATDGDADRIAIIDERGEYITTNDILLLVYWYMHEIRGERGGVIRNLATTHLLDRMCAKFGEKCVEVPVGFKHIASGMVANNSLLGGESSGGLTIRGHILGKDGIFACALMVEMLAKTGQRISDMLETVYAITGRLYSLEEGLPSTPEMRVDVPRRLAENPLTEVAGYPVVKITNYDGLKIFLENDNWVLLRFSGTEPVLRLFVEADSPEKAQTLMHWLQHFVTG
jgi:phosphomannomutase/UTP-glucose-1-phosphate uridylyltransferase